MAEEEILTVDLSVIPVPWMFDGMWTDHHAPDRLWTIQAALLQSNGRTFLHVEGGGRTISAAMDDLLTEIDKATELLRGILDRSTDAST